MNMNYSSFKTALLFKRRQNCTKKFAHYYQNFKSVITVMAVTVHIGVDHASFNCIRHVAPTCTPSNSISTGSAIFAALTVVIDRQTVYNSWKYCKSRGILLMFLENIYN